jgi:transposase-like protein
MSECTSSVAAFPQIPANPLEDLLKEGARRLLAQAVEAEVAAYINAHSHLKDGNGRRLVVRNGHHPERSIQTGLGGISVRQPKVNDGRVDGRGERIRFSSAILPKYLRRTKNIEELIPWLYLKGVSTGDFSEALAALLGKDAPGLSASTVTRLKEVWTAEYETWRSQVINERIVYIWADGIHFNIRLGEDDRMCMLVIIGATADGHKRILAVEPGYRESAMSWKEILLRLRSQGLSIDPELATADGALGFWQALRELFPITKEQRCWVHKTANILDKLPKSRQPQAKGMLHEIYLAATLEEAYKAINRFVEVFEAKYPRAVSCLLKDKDETLEFYNFPAEHWIHIRSTNPIESSFATVRHRTRRTKGCGSSKATTAMVFKLLREAEKSWRKLRGYKLLADVIDINVVFVNGERRMAA